VCLGIEHLSGIKSPVSGTFKFIPTSGVVGTGVLEMGGVHWMNCKDSFRAFRPACAGVHSMNWKGLDPFRIFPPNLVLLSPLPR